MAHLCWISGFLFVLNWALVLPSWSQSHSARTVELIDTISPSQKLYEEGHDPVGFRSLNQGSWVVGYSGGYFVGIDGDSHSVNTIDCELTSFVFFDPGDYVLISLEGLFVFQSGIVHKLNNPLSGYPMTIQRSDQNSFCVLDNDGVIRKYSRKKDDQWCYIYSQSSRNYAKAKNVVVFETDTIILAFDTLQWRSPILDSLHDKGLLPVDVFDIDGRDNLLYLLTPTHASVVDMKTGEFHSLPHNIVFPLDIYASTDEIFGIVASGGEVYVFAFRSAASPR